MISHDINAAVLVEQVRDVLALAERRGATAREKRRMLRERFRSLSALTCTRARWYREAVRQAGCLLMDLPDARQARLIEIGPRVRRPRRKKTTHVAA